MDCVAFVQRTLFKDLRDLPHGFRYRDDVLSPDQESALITSLETGSRHHGSYCAPLRMGRVFAQTGAPILVSVFRRSHGDGLAFLWNNYESHRRTEKRARADRAGVVVQQGMSSGRRQARRYHWSSEGL